MIEKTHSYKLRVIDFKLVYQIVFKMRLQILDNSLNLRILNRVNINCANLVIKKRA